MMPDQAAPLCLLVSPNAEAVVEEARLHGLRLVPMADVADTADQMRFQVLILDARTCVDPLSFGPLPDFLPVIALIDETSSPAGLLELGITHFLSWPTDMALFMATFEAVSDVYRRLATGGRNGSVPTPGPDALTGLVGRAAAREWLAARLLEVTDEPVSACLLIGISQFASINTAYGKGAGDAALARIARRIERCVRRTLGEEALVARMGGTEYLVAYSAGESSAVDSDAQDLARLLLAHVARPFVADDKVIRLIARCGIAIPRAGDDASSLLRRASAALTDARRSATEDIIVRTGVRRRGKAHHDDVDRLDADLRLALDAGEIGIVYQPQYDSRSDRIIGVEALARWNHPRLGQLDAGTLFEAADRSDYLLPLSRHIQRTALAEAGCWPRGLDGLRLAINVTAADLAQEDFVPRLLGRIERSGFPCDRLTIEITESGLIENIGRAGDLLRELRRMDLRVAIDDFGTGYSSLAYLKSLHPDYLKIDHSLSRDILGTPRDRVILRAIIAMARSLALTVIAEGVETEEQLTLLAREGCDIYQGFLRSPAVTSEELMALVSGH